MSSNNQKSVARNRRHIRVRAKVAGTKERPRLVVFRSLQYTYAQVIDDVAGKTLLQAGSSEFKDKNTKVEAATRVGKLIAERSLASSIKQVVFDRGGNKYHGRVKALADAAREGGLEF